MRTTSSINLPNSCALGDDRGETSTSVHLSSVTRCDRSGSIDRKAPTLTGPVTTLVTELEEAIRAGEKDRALALLHDLREELARIGHGDVR